MSVLVPVAATLAGVALVGLAAELATRWALARFGGYYPQLPGLRQRFEIDQEALPMVGTEVRWQVNSDGERGSEAPKGAYRVLLAGGSCVESYYLDQSDAVFSQLEAALAAPERSARLGHAAAGGVHVGSVARSRISCAQIHRMLVKSLPRYERLDCIVLMVGASDMVRWLEVGTPTETWVDEPPVSHLFGLHPEGPFHWSPGGLALRAGVSRLRQRFAGRVEQRSGVGKRLIALRAHRAKCNPKVDVVPDPGLMVERFGTDLGAMVEYLKTRARTVVLARQPWFDKQMTPEEQRWMWNFGQGVIYSTDVDVYYTHRVVGELMRRCAERCGQVAREQGVVDLDLSEVVPASLDNFYDFLHFTPAGAAKVGAAVADAIVAATEGDRAG